MQHNNTIIISNKHVILFFLHLYIFYNKVLVPKRFFW